MKASYVIKHLSGSLLFFLVLFICAGRVDYWQGWAYVAIGLVMITLNYTFLRIDPGLLEERAGPHEGTKVWDKRILGISFLVTLSMYVTAGLDSGRFHWSPEFHWGLFLSGAILVAGGQLLYLVAQHQNKFFSSTVRIQADRGHTVCETGAYRVVRHPAYLGSVIQSVGFPLLFCSLWSILPAGILVVLFVIRTSLEDRVLMSELNGYKEYALKTRYRMIPGIW